MQISFEAQKELVKLIKNEECDIDALLSYAYFLLTNGLSEQEYNFAYNVILEYTIKFEDYEPLQELCLIFGFSPIINIINKKGYESKHEMQNLIAELYKKENVHRDKILTSGQKILYKMINETEDYSIVAPTSYGKTDLMIESAFKCDGDVIIIVPLVALLNQVKHDIQKYAKENNKKVKVITHHEINPSLYVKNVYVLTQERCYELLKNKKLKNIKELYIDESHNLLKLETRSLKLSEVIVLLKKKYDVTVKYFSPVLQDASSIMIKGLYNAPLITVEKIRDMKIYNYFILQNNKKYIYFPNLKQLNKNFIIDDNYKSKIDYIIKNSKSKNIIFLNSPKEIEKFAIKISKKIGIVNEKEFQVITDFLGKDYYINDVLKSGTIYIHGQMPDLVKSYLLELYKNDQTIKYLVTNSSILEGVNSPSDNLFILDYKIGKKIMKFTDFTNLKGRINRVGDIVKTNDLKRLKCDIHFVLESKSKCDTARNRFIDEICNDKIDDIIENPYINKCDLDNIDKPEKIDEFIDSISKINLVDEKIDIEEMFDKHPKMDFENDFIKLCLKNDIKLNDKQVENIKTRVDLYKNKKIDTINELLNCIVYVFNLELDEELKIKRLSIDKTKNYYSMLIQWLIEGKTIKEKALRMTRYYEKNNNELIFIGKSRGEICAELKDGKMFIRKNGLSKFKLNDKGYPIRLDKVWINCNKDHKTLFNICVVKIKIEEDFISYNLLPYIETLNIYKENIISYELYNLIKYKTNNAFTIKLVKEGLSIYLANLLTQDKYKKFVTIDDVGVHISNSILSVFDENEILLSELKLYLL